MASDEAFLTILLCSGRSPGSGPSLTGGVPSEVGLLLDLEHFRVGKHF